MGCPVRNRLATETSHAQNTPHFTQGGYLRVPRAFGVGGRFPFDAMQASQFREIDIEPERFVMPVRDVVL